jgi:hypothetical protein
MKGDGGERVREYYRTQGEKREQERIIAVIQSIMDKYQAATEEFDVLNDLVECIKNPISPCVWCGLLQMDVYASANGKDICINCEEKALEGNTNE